MGVLRASALFVDVALGPHGTASADDANDSSAVSVAYYEETALIGHPEREKAAFADGMIWIGKRHG
jgi:hypothetical protein